MLSVPDTWDDFVSDSRRHAVRHVAFRWYYKKSALPWADENGSRFSQWLLRFKSQDQRALNLFAYVLWRLWRPGNPSEWAIGAAPPASAEAQGSSLRALTHWISEQRAGVLDLGPAILRAQSLPRAVHDSSVRDVNVQRASMRFPERMPSSVRHVLLIDDVWTTGSTLKACVLGLQEVAPTIEFTTLAFGRTQRTGSTPFPVSPQFAELSTSASASFEELVRDAPHRERLEIATPRDDEVDLSESAEDDEGDSSADDLDDFLPDEDENPSSGSDDPAPLSDPSDRIENLLLAVASRESIAAAKASLEDERTALEAEWETDGDGDLISADSARAVRVVEGDTSSALALLRLIDGEKWVWVALTASASTASSWLHGNPVHGQVELLEDDPEVDARRIDYVVARHLLSELMARSF